LFLLPVDSQALLDAAALLQCASPRPRNGSMPRFSMSECSTAVPTPSRRAALVRRKEDVGVGRLAQLFDADAGLQLPGAAEKIAAAVSGFDTRAGVGAVTGAQRHLVRRALAQLHAHRRATRHRSRTAGAAASLPRSRVTLTDEK
jgi:hypothetical protein